MKEVRCLFWDDEDEQDRKRYEGWLRRAWDRLGTGVPIEVRSFQSPEEVSREISSNIDKYDLFVADIYYGPEEDDPRGLHLISEARANGSLAIVALTRGEDEKDARNAGADEFVSKLVISRRDYDLSNLGSVLLTALRKRGYEPLPTEKIKLIVDSDDLPLGAVMETLGRENLVSLVLKILRPRMCSVMSVGFIRPGLSGAIVLRIECELEVEQGKAPEGRSLLIKASRDRSQLDAEVMRRRDVETFPSGLFVPFLLGDVVDSGGWHAIGANFQAAAKTLVDWLGVRQSKAEIELAMRTLFLEGGLGDIYKRSILDPDTRPNVAIWSLLAIQRRARILLAVKELGPLAEKYGLGFYEERLIINFISDARRIGDLNEEEVSRGVRYCRCHGDLHGRNILILEGRVSSMLVDPANIRQLHWASDVARLCVDLIVSVMDKGMSSFEWEQDRIRHWLLLCDHFIQGELTSLREDEADGVRVALQWVRLNLEKIFGKEILQGLFEAEFRLTLAVEFLRAAYREQDLPGPKRTLGLVAGCLALRAAEKAFVAT